jgi:hypothetical protein
MRGGGLTDSLWAEKEEKEERRQEKKNNQQRRPLNPPMHECYNNTATHTPYLIHTHTYRLFISEQDRYSHFSN